MTLVLHSEHGRRSRAAPRVKIRPAEVQLAPHASLFGGYGSLGRQPSQAVAANPEILGGPPRVGQDHGAECGHIIIQMDGASRCPCGGYGHLEAYASAKAALVPYVKALARNLAPKGVRANMVSPGNVYFKGGVWNTVEERTTADGVREVTEAQLHHVMLVARAEATPAYDEPRLLEVRRAVPDVAALLAVSWDHIDPDACVSDEVLARMGASG